MAVFIANVGVNASHRARSPLFPDGRFLLLPIPEKQEWAAPMLRLADVPELAEQAPADWGGRAVHLDPDFRSEVPTYGDNCRRAARAFALRKADSGDRIVFVARLHPVRGPAAFYLVGELEIDAILRDVSADPGSGWWDSNAHVRRARAGQPWDSFWIFRGTARSRLYDRPRLFDRAAAESCFGAGAWTWRPNRSELQTIGSYTRTIRRLPA